MTSTGSQARAQVPVVGIAGWKKSGKTTLVVRLIEEFTRRGLKVATVKHAHHDFQIDDGDTDSARHRRAGAAQVAIVSSKRWAVVHELADAPEPELGHVVSQLGACDLVIVEGYKSARIPKIEVRRSAAFSRETLADKDPDIMAIVADHDVAGNGLSVFSLDDIAGIAEFIAKAVDVGRAASSTSASP